MALLRLLGLALLWGTAFLGMKVCGASFNPPAVTALRALLGALLLVAVLAATRRRFPARRLWGDLALLGVIGVALPYSLYAWAAHLIPSSLAGSINSATPLFTLLIGLLAGRIGRPSRWQLLGLVLGFTGTLVMMRPWDATGSALGAAIAVVASACYGLTYNVQAARVSGKDAPLPLAAGQLAFAVPAAAIAIPFAGPAVTQVTATTAVALGFLGLACTGVAYLLNYQIIAADGPLLASTVTYLIPVVAIVTGVLLAGEGLAWTTVVGIAITLIGVALTRRQDR